MACIDAWLSTNIGRFSLKCWCFLWHMLFLFLLLLVLFDNCCPFLWPHMQFWCLCFLDHSFWWLHLRTCWAWISQSRFICEHHHCFFIVEGFDIFYESSLFVVFVLFRFVFNLFLWLLGKMLSRFSMVNNSNVCWFTDGSCTFFIPLHFFCLAIWVRSCFSNFCKCLELFRVG